MSDLKCQVMPSGTTSFHVWKQGAQSGDLCECGGQSLGEGIMTDDMVPMSRLREVIKANEKHYQEACTLKSKLTEMCEVLQWSTENVASASVSEDGWWVSVATNGTGTCKFHNLSTLYQALKSAWEARQQEVNGEKP